MSRVNYLVRFDDTQMAGIVSVLSYSVFLSGLRLSDGELLIVASHHLKRNAVNIYGLHWEIETLFGFLKGRGFKLEETRVAGYLRIKKLWVLPVIGFCWSHKVGEWKHDCKLPIKIKSHQRLAQSLFRYDLDYIRSTLCTALEQPKRMIKTLISLLSHPRQPLQLAEQ